MIKKTFTITENNLLLLTKEASNLGISTAELLRRIIDDFFYKKDN